MHPTVRDSTLKPLNDTAAVDVRIIAASAIAILALLFGWAAFNAVKTWTTSNPSYALATMVLVAGVVVMIAGPRRVGKLGPIIGTGMVLVSIGLFYLG